MCMAMLFNAIVMATMVAAGLLAGHLPVTLKKTVSLAAINIGGALPFSAIGLFIGVLVSGSAAPGFVNLIYFPMMLLSGLFIPCPKSLQSEAPLWGLSLVRHLWLVALGKPAAGSALMHTAVLAGLTLVLS